MDRTEKTPPTFLLCRGNMFTEPLLRVNFGGIHRGSHKPSSDNTRTAQKMTPPTFLLCRGNMFTEPSLRVNFGGDTQRDPQTLF
jgi:hypothetical protein